MFKTQYTEKQFIDVTKQIQPEPRSTQRLFLRLKLSVSPFIFQLLHIQAGSQTV